MIRVKCSIRQFKLDDTGHGKLPKSYVDWLNSQMWNAAREWMRTVIVRIPLWSGHARGALAFAKGRSGDSAGVFLSTFLRVAVKTQGTRTANNKPTRSTEWKNPEQGGRESRFTFTFDKSRKRFNFTFNTDVIHLYYNDMVNSATGAPYGSQGAGAWKRPWGAFAEGHKVMKAYLETKRHGGKRVPRLRDMLIELPPIVKG